jgi:hypothetical protein
MGPELTPQEFGEAISKALAQYDASEATRVSAQIRAEAGPERIVSEFLSLYETVITEHAATAIDREAEARAAASYLRQFALRETATELFAERVNTIPIVGRLAYRAAHRFAARERERKK